MGASHVYVGMDVDIEHILQQHNDYCSPNGIKIFSWLAIFGVLLLE